LTCFVFQLRVILHIECVLTQIIVVDSEWISIFCFCESVEFRIWNSKIFTCIALYKIVHFLNFFWLVYENFRIIFRYYLRRCKTLRNDLNFLLSLRKDHCVCTTWHLAWRCSACLATIYFAELFSHFPRGFEIVIRKNIIVQ
jgi:hypothetical protein